MKDWNDIPDAPRSESDARLYAALRSTLSFLHKKTPREDALNALRSRYPAPMFIPESDRSMLDAAGLARSDALLVGALPALARHTARERFAEKPRLDHYDCAAEYLKSFYIGIHVECFYLLCLDKSGQLIAPIMLDRGTDSSAPFQIKQLLSAAIRCGASGAVLCHNHPKGTREPSREDLVCTLYTLKIIPATGIILLDHIIIACDETVGLRGRAIPEPIWRMQNENSRLNRNWLQPSADT